MNPELFINGTLTVVGVGFLVAGIIGFIRHKNTQSLIFSGIATAVGAVMLVIVLLTTSLSSASGSNSFSLGQTGSPIIDNGAIVTGKITSIIKLDTTPQWQIKLRIESIGNDGDLPNLLNYMESEVIELRADNNPGNFNVGQEITAQIKLSGNVETGTFYYLLNLK